MINFLKKKKEQGAEILQIHGGDEIYKKINTACLITIAAACIMAVLAYTRTVLIPLVISVLIYTMMAPIIRYMRFKFRFPRWLAVLATSILVLVPLIMVILFMINSVANFVQFAVAYQVKLIQAFNWVAALVRSYNIPFVSDVTDMQGITSMISGQQIGSLFKSIGGLTLKIISYSVLVFIFVLFFLMGSGRGGTKSNPIMKDVQDKVSGYIFIHIIFSILTGFLVGIVYFAAGIELAMMFAILTVILNFIPNVGSIVAVILPLPIAIIQYGFGPHFWVVLIIPSIIQFTLGNIVEPKLLGTGLDLHPVAVVGSLVFWALIWGIPGAFLAVPITSGIRLILSYMEPTRPIAEILAGRMPK